MKYDNIYQHNLRLNLDKKEHLEAHRYLMQADTKRFGSKNEYVVQAILKGAERLEHPEREHESNQQFNLNEEQLDAIATKVIETMKAEILNEVLKTLLGMIVSNPTSLTQPVPIQKPQDIDSLVDDYIAESAMDYFEE